MAAHSAAIDLLHAQIAEPDTQWSLGTFGGIAEFSRDRDEKVSLMQSATGAAAVTARGGIAIDLPADCRPFAFECITRSGWSQRVALCLPAGDCAMNRRTVLTELNVDRESLQLEHRGSTLFDLGLGALQVDLCVRIDDHNMAARLRSHCGRSVFEPTNPAMGLLLETNPHRVFISRIGRIEVYQPIPEGWIPCAHLYPGHPVRDAGDLFDAACHDSFQRMIERFGLPECLAIKRRVVDAIGSGEPPSNLAITLDRHGRTGVRIALRQLKAAGTASPVLKEWLAEFDHAVAGNDADEAVLQHAH